ncbi:MAG: glycosyltransferase family 2 protein [Candidatus Micrarchaeia archaeon]
MVIPFYDEQENVDRLVNSLSNVFNKHKVDFELVCIDNGSSDNTGSLLKKASLINSRVKVVSVPENLGYGWGVKQGFAAAKGEVICLGWGDNQVLPEVFYEVFERFNQTDCDLCKVTRVVRQDGFNRIVESKGFNFLFSVFFGSKVFDVNGCPKVFSRKLLDEFTLLSNDYFLDAEIVIGVLQKKGKIVDVPCKFLKREAGKSSVGFFTIYEFMANMLRYRLLNINIWRRS